MEHTPLLIAALLVFVIGLIHSWLGEVRLIGPLLDPQKRRGMLEKSVFARQILRFAWHLTTIAWWGFGAVLASYAFSAPDNSATYVLGIIAATFFVTGIITLVTSRGRHLAWPVFLAIAGLSLWPIL